MAKAPDILVLPILREIRKDIKSTRGDISRINTTLIDVRRHVASLDKRMEALDEKFDMSREGTVSAIGCAANASRGHVERQRQIADLARRVDKLEQAK